MELRGRRVTVMGLGRHGGGVAAAQYLAQRGATLTVTDLAPADCLQPSLAKLAALPIARYRLGEHHPDDFTQADFVVVNPAVKPDSPWIALAQLSGARIISEIELFLSALRAPVIAVTGSNGKSTTCAMLAAMLEADGRKVHLGGNIGRSLLPVLPNILPNDWVVLELSSFQLYWLQNFEFAPRVAVVTNCTANHLDWHSSLGHYCQSKQRLLRYQTAADSVVLGLPDLTAWRERSRGRHVALPQDADLPMLAVGGAHNRQNARCAAAAAAAVGCRDVAIRTALMDFRGLPHRQQVLGEFAGRRCVDDSKSTTPEATIAALAAQSSGTWLLAGGFDKGVQFDNLAAALQQSRVLKGLAVFGAARHTLLQAMRELTVDVAGFEYLNEATHWCWERSAVGDCILLSPACSSLDQFADYVDRANCFAECIKRLGVHDRQASAPQSLAV